ncbi:hypothetical protein OG2516_12276 [Oceanicola granulosus HTCC2516]|uniref:M23ase beta-sheet core domain-containing protein n=1 Tax=Oceanicola granulosus (strain ATCC BAA-861 / DSM 15982 / KCTC 12143 / HTCC2516) TaxID=314256 RepID=Q2CD53_OCEGH|nr:peptidoglycan DD-metalloendopeptidase family protein [Oceanicola granulosus]EAR50625.1 hypothetical protein OG2516_12276 [Oceanicola granulosus HTCC2516]
MIRALALLLLLAAAPAAAQTGPAAAAEAAAERLDRAARLLAEAESGSDQVAALTETVRAYEDGLDAMRDGLRRAAIRERTLSVEFAARRGELSRLLGVLTTLSTAPTPLLLLHPSGPTGTARSGMILSEATPALQREVARLTEQLEELELLRALQTSAADTLEAGLLGAQEARAALSQAIAERRDLPRRYTEDRAAMASLLASTETLTAFAGGLAETVGEELPGPSPDATARKGTLALPAQGRVLRGYAQADAAGVARPGWLIATRAQTLVTAPVAATVRYAGPLLDYGNVVIIEPASDVLFVFAGLGEVYGATGEVVPEGAPLGVMGGASADIDAILTETAGGADAPLSETLYVEVREAQETVDPGTWFAEFGGTE